MNPTVRQEDLDNLLTSTGYSFRRWNRVKRGLSELKNIRATLESRIDRDNEADIIIAEKELEDTNAKKGKLLDLYLDDTFTKEQLDSRVQPLEIIVQELQDRIKALSKTNEDLYQDIADIDEVIKVFEEENEQLQEEANNGNIANKYSRKELLKDIENIVVGTDGELTLNFKSLSIIRQLTNKYRHLLEQAS